MKIVLIGFMGAGKTTVARRLGAQLNYPVIEMDELVCRKANARNMNEVFAKGGELLLRETEIAIAKECALQENGVVSTGGGVVLNKIVLDYFREKGGKIFFLNASFETLAKRLEGDDARPLLRMTSARKLYDFRKPLYLNYADAVIDADIGSPEEIALQIQRCLDGF